MPTSRRPWLTLLSALLLPAAQAVFAEGEDIEELDIIRRADTTQPVLTKVVKEDYLVVEGRYRSSAVKLESYKVADILRADRPEEYNMALERRQAGKLTVAARFFLEALDRAKDKPWAREYCNFGLAEALYEAGHFAGYKGLTHDYRPPEAYYAEVIKANPRSRFLLESSVKRAICLIEQGKFGEAEKALQEAERNIRTYKEDAAKLNDPKYRPAADRAETLVRLARAKQLERKADQEQRGDYGAALSAAIAAQSSAQSGRFMDVYAEAVEIELRALVKGRDYAGAESRALRIIEKYRANSDPDLIPMLPVAYTVLGRANFAMASQHETRNATGPAQTAYAESRWNYLQVLFQFFDREEYLGEATYYVALCNDKLKPVEPDAGERAVRYWLDVKRLFPNSDYAKRAADDLKRVGYVEPKKEPAKTELGPTIGPAAKKAEPPKKR